MRAVFNLVLLISIVNLHRVYGQTPDRTYWITPDSLSLKYHQDTVFTEDGAKLLSWFIDAEKPGPIDVTIIIAYATTGSMANCLYYANALSKAGYNVELFDYRGFGHSSDLQLNKSLLYQPEFVTDLESVIKFVKQKHPKTKIGILGFSIGTLLSTLAFQKEPVNFIVGEGFVTDPSELVDFWRKNGNRNYSIPPGCNDYTRTLYEIKCPMLLISGTEDIITPAEKSLETVRGHKNRELLTFKGDHLQATQIWQEKSFADGLVNRIRHFIERITWD